MRKKNSITLFEYEYDTRVQNSSPTLEYLKLEKNSNTNLTQVASVAPGKGNDSVEAMLLAVDPHEHGFVTFSDCVVALSQVEL